MFHLISLSVSPRTSPGPGRGSRGAGGGIGSDPMKLQLRGGEGEHKSWEQKFFLKTHFVSNSSYLGSISCTTDSRTLEAQGGAGRG